MQFQIDGKCGQEVVYDTHRPAILKRDLMGMCMDGNWKIWVRDCGSESMSIYAIRERVAEFSNVRGLTFSTLELVDQVHRLTVSMGQMSLVQELVNEFTGW